MTKEEMIEIMGVSSKSDNTSPLVSSSHREPDPENTIVGLEAEPDQEKDVETGINDVYMDLEECVEKMKAMIYVDMKYMKQLLKITEQDSKSDITSVAASSAHGQNRKYTFEEINKDLIQIKNELIALNLDIFADIIRTESIAISEDMTETFRVQLKDVLQSVEHAYESYISVLTVLIRRNYLSVLYLDTLATKYGATYSEIVSIRTQMTMIAMALIAPKMPSTPHAASSKHNPNTKDIVVGLKEDLVKVILDQLTGNCSAESEDVSHCSKDRIRDALQNVEQAYEPNLPDLIDLLKIHHISVLDKLKQANS